MLVRCEQLGELEVRTDNDGNISLVFAHDEKGEDDEHGNDNTYGFHDAAYLEQEAATIERLMEDIRKPSVILRDYLISISAKYWSAPR